MAKEIERKFLVDLAHWPNEAKGLHFEQGYIAITDSGIVRVRIIRDEVSTLTVKSSGTGLSRDEFQYEIPMDEAKALLKLCQNDIIEKTIQLVYDEYPKEVLIRSLIQKRGFKLGLRIEKKELDKVYKLKDQ